MGDDLVIRLSNLHTIEVIDSYKKGCRTSVTYLADGVQKDCTGEFYVDKEGRWHHTHEFANGTEIEFTF